MSYAITNPTKCSNFGKQGLKWENLYYYIDTISIIKQVKI